MPTAQNIHDNQLRGKCPGGHYHRRDFLRVGSLPFLGISLSQFLRARNLWGSSQVDRHATAKSCIMVWLDGGPPQTDTWDPKPTSSFKSVPTNVPGIHVCELLPRLSQRADKLALIRSVRTPENNHGGASHYIATAHQPNPAMKFPGIGAIVSRELGSQGSIPPHVMVPGMPKGSQYDEYFKAHIAGPEYDPLILPDPSHDNFAVPDLQLPKSVSGEMIRQRLSFLEIVDRHYRLQNEINSFKSMDSFLQQAWNMILSPQVRQAFDLGQESEKTRDTYGRNGFGQSLLLARRLVEAGSRFVTAAGFAPQAWDTHSNHDKSMKDKLAPSLDRTLSALLDDLHQRGLLDETVVVVLGEFGRTAHINVRYGRDHWPECWSIAMAGGGIKGGQTVGASDERGAYVAERMVTMGDIFATIYSALGIDWHKEYMHPIGRPVKIANSIDDTTGQPIAKLL